MTLFCCRTLYNFHRRSPDFVNVSVCMLWPGMSFQHEKYWLKQIDTLIQLPTCLNYGCCVHMLMNQQKHNASTLLACWPAVGVPTCFCLWHVPVNACMHELMQNASWPSKYPHSMVPYLLMRWAWYVGPGVPAVGHALNVSVLCAQLANQYHASCSATKSVNRPTVQHICVAVLV